MSNRGKRYSARFQFHGIERGRKEVEIARAYNIHPATISHWKQEFAEKGAEVFGKSRR